MCGWFGFRTHGPKGVAFRGVCYDGIVLVPLSLPVVVSSSCRKRGVDLLLFAFLF